MDMRRINHDLIARRMPIRLALNSIAKVLFLLATIVGLLVLGILFYRIVSQGAGHISFDFLQNFASRNQRKQG